MRLLITTQAVDLDDPVLGFFHRWIEEIAKGCEHVSVICLKEGRHSLPSNVTVYSLGKESGASRIKYVTRFYRYIWMLRGDYDAIYAHMNQEYVLLGGILWKLWGKPIVLWRNHKMGALSTLIAARLAHTVCYTSPAAYVAHYKNAVRMPIGIDTELFKRPAALPPMSPVLFLGRIDGVKRPLEFLSALTRLISDGFDLAADIYGDPTYVDDPFFVRFKDALAPLEAAGRAKLRHAIPNSETPAIYGAHAIYVNLTPSGSFDKTIGEAMACGCVVVCANDAVRGVIPDALITDPANEESVVAGIRTALLLSPGERESIIRASRQYIEREHSLKLLAEKLALILRASRRK